MFSPVVRGDWLWDDPAEITTNTALRDRAGLAKIWFAPDSPDYYPLKTTLQWVQWHLWGSDPTGYHLTNICLHLLSALLIWRLLGKLGVKQAWIGGLIFSIHPLAVESVAWISELKNVLSLPLLLLAMGFFIDYDEEKIGKSAPSEATGLQIGKRRAPGCYILSLTCFVAAMLSKSSVVMFPVILLLYCWWKHGRVTRTDLLASAPFFGISLVLGLVTVWFQHTNAISTLVINQGGFLPRVAVAGLAAVFYFAKCVFPFGLLPIYPRWNIDPPEIWEFLPWIIIGMAILWLIRLHRPSARHALFGLGWFLVNLAPVLGFIPMSYLRISWVADHFAYLPLVGLVGLGAAGLTSTYDFLNREGGEDGEGSDPSVSPFSPTSLFKCIFWCVIVAVIAGLAIESRRYAGNFKSEEALWTYTLERNPEAWLAHNNLSNILLNEKRTGEAEAHLREAIALKPDFPEAHNNLGNILLNTGRLEEAKSQFDEALRLKPNYAEACNGLGNYFLRSGNAEMALAKYHEALRMKPDYPDCLDNVGAALDALGRPGEAIAEYKQVLRMKPGFALAHYNMGISLEKIGRRTDAIAQYEEAWRLDPNLIEACNNLANALVAEHRTSEAIARFEEALRHNPNYFEIHFNLGNALFNTGRIPEAKEQFEEVLRLKRGYPAARANLDRIQAMQSASAPR